MSAHEGNHDGTHDDCFGCRIFHVQLSVSAMPSRRNKVPPRTVEPGFIEKGVAGTERKGGGFMPFLEPNGSTMGEKQYRENKRRVDAEVKAVRQGHI